MRTKGQVGQIICTCGRVGELRTRGNGKFLPFLMCKHCGMKQGKEALRDQWLAEEQPNGTLGVYGEFPQGSEPTSNEASEAVVITQVETSNVTSKEVQKEWVPPEELAPEIIEPESESTPDEPVDTPKKGLGLLPKIGIGMFSALCLAFGVKKLNLARQIKG